MRNAKISDCFGGWRFNVMYNVKHAWYGFVLAHIKEKVVVCGTPMFAMETHDGCPILAEYSWLHPIPRKQGTPAKPKRKPIKGSKPWLSKFEYVDYDLMKILVEKKIDKPAHDRYNGYLPSVWHFWQGNTAIPPVDPEVCVRLWLRKDDVAWRGPYYAGAYRWKWDNEYPQVDIIAFKIVGEC